jgi:hypothetical protein
VHISHGRNCNAAYKNNRIKNDSFTSVVWYYVLKLHSELCHFMELSVQLHAPTALIPGKESWLPTGN